jgi:hypothetical protein
VSVRMAAPEYAPDGLAEPVKRTGQRQVDRRTDPARTRGGGPAGDVGMHAVSPASLATVLTAVSLAATSVTTAMSLPRFFGGAPGGLLGAAKLYQASRPRFACDSDVVDPTPTDGVVRVAFVGSDVRSLHRVAA